jgi:hypothetical protein
MSTWCPCTKFLASVYSESLKAAMNMCTEVCELQHSVPSEPGWSSCLYAVYLPGLRVAQVRPGVERHQRAAVLTATLTRLSTRPGQILCMSRAPSRLWHFRRGSSVLLHDASRVWYRLRKKRFSYCEA